MSEPSDPLLTGGSPPWDLSHWSLQKTTPHLKYKKNWETEEEEKFKSRGSLAWWPTQIAAWKVETINSHYTFWLESIILSLELEVLVVFWGGALIFGQPLQRVVFTHRVCNFYTHDVIITHLQTQTLTRFTHYLCVKFLVKKAMIIQFFLTNIISVAEVWMIMLTIVDLFEFDQNLDRSTPAQLSYVMKSDLLWNFTFSFLHFSWQRRSASLWKLIEKVDMGAGKSWKLIWEQRKVPAWDCRVRSHH